MNFILYLSHPLCFTYVKGGNISFQRYIKPSPKTKITITVKILYVYNLIETRIYQR